MKATLKEMFKALDINLPPSMEIEIKWACDLIIEVQALSSGERDYIREAYKNGPLFDNDYPLKTGMDNLLNKGFMARVVVNGVDGYNACTQKKGYWAFKLLALEDHQ